MEKPFFDVFPTLELNTELKNLFAVTKVTRVALTKARDFLKVYLFSEKLSRRNTFIRWKRRSGTSFLPVCR